MSNVFLKEKWNADDMKRGILKERRVIGCNIKNNDKSFWRSHVYSMYFFLQVLNYYCANSYLFNRIPWLLVSHNITSLYLLSNKDVIRATYIKTNIYSVIIFTEATSLVASMEDTPLIVDHLYIIVEEIVLIVDCGRGQNVTELA